ncbi:MAG: radical SAM protein [Deltaproteobacteria bacterium]|nr:radical SAM protein [Deltaproteobacteria bacterium]
MALRVNEIFYSIQGESSFAGRPCVFIRLTGCNLRCAYCDTRYAYEAGEAISIEVLLEKVAAYRCPLVEITGGEPLLQAETPPLIRRLLDAGYRVLLETNGSRNISLVDDRCTRILDIKCPASGEAQNNDLGNLNRLSARDEIKFVLSDRGDYDFAKGIMVRNDFPLGLIEEIHFSSVPGKLAPKTLAEWILADRLPVRLHLQLHKLIWGPEARGV